MINREPCTPLSSDCTMGYAIQLENYTVLDFINEVLKQFPNEYGCFHLKTSDMTGWFDGPRLEYRYGKQTNLATEEFAKYFNTEIKEVKASGGYSCMDYYICIEASPKAMAGDIVKSKSTNSLYKVTARREKKDAFVAVPIDNSDLQEYFFFDSEVDIVPKELFGATLQCEKIAKEVKEKITQIVAETNIETDTVYELLIACLNTVR